MLSKWVAFNTYAKQRGVDFYARVLLVDNKVKRTDGEADAVIAIEEVVLKQDSGPP